MLSDTDSNEIGNDNVNNSFENAQKARKNKFGEMNGNNRQRPTIHLNNTPNRTNKVIKGKNSRKSKYRYIL